MARRKRLTPAQPGYLEPGGKEPEPLAPEVKSAGGPLPRAPIAQVAADASAVAALQELAAEVQRAREEGRLVQALPLAAIEVGYLARDRIAADTFELDDLVASIRARGQQTPIEAVVLGDGRYGLISGWRRLTALRRLHDETGEARFATVQAILRRPETAPDAYVAMVEENEIRLGLSYYERARIVAKAVEQGVFETDKQALLALFSTASRAKRSKIRSFLTLYRAADDLLSYPHKIPERLGLALVKGLEAGPENHDLLRQALTGRPAAGTVEEETALLQELVQAMAAKATLPADAGTKPGEELKAANRKIPPGAEEVVHGVTMSYSGHSLTLKGPRVTEELQRKLVAVLKSLLGG